MSYKVQYDPELDRKYPALGFKNKKLKRKIIVLSLSALIFGTVLARSELARYFIPGDPEVTTAAFSTLIEQVGKGENATDAIMTFCREIIQYSS